MMENKRYKLSFVNVLKILACILIINSHCRSFYPAEFLAVGGSFGNSLFFIVSGYCLANIKLPLGKWYLKRIKRIIPSLIIIIILDIIINYFAAGMNSAYWGLFPSYFINKYWFVFAIFIYYFIYYFIFRKYSKTLIKVVLLIYIILYIALYVLLVDKSLYSVEQEGFGWFKVVFYFSVIMTGGLIKKEDLQNKFDDRKLLLLIGTIGSAALWAVSYYIIVFKNICLIIQPITQIFIYMFSVAALLLFSQLESSISRKQWLNSRLLVLIADSTLEIYFIQILINKLIIFIFPINIIVFYLASIVAGCLMHILVEKLVRINERS